jgi:hypothetical protein
VRKVTYSVIVAGRAVVKEDGREVELLEEVDMDAFFEYVECLARRAHFPTAWERSDFVIEPARLDRRTSA